jgi:hypothetical protein
MSHRLVNEVSTSREITRAPHAPAHCEVYTYPVQCVVPHHRQVMARKSHDDPVGEPCSTTEPCLTNVVTTEPDCTRTRKCGLGTTNHAPDICFDRPRVVRTTEKKSACLQARTSPIVLASFRIEDCHRIVPTPPPRSPVHFKAFYRRQRSGFDMIAWIIKKSLSISIALCAPHKTVALVETAPES